MVQLLAQMCIRDRLTPRLLFIVVVFWKKESIPFFFVSFWEGIDEGSCSIILLSFESLLYPEGRRNARVLRKNKKNKEKKMTNSCFFKQPTQNGLYLRDRWWETRFLSQFSILSTFNNVDLLFFFFSWSLFTRSQRVRVQLSPNGLW